MINRFLLLIVATATLAGLLFGYDTGVISGASIFIERTFSLTVEQTEMVVSSVIVGAIIGAIASGKLADSLGRRYMLLVCAYVFIVGSILSGLAFHLLWLVVGRLMVGTAIGAASYIAPLYISEIAPKEHRGKLVILNTLTVTGGIALSYWADYLLSPIAAWRWMFMLGAFPAVLLGFGVLLLPNSPRWMALQGWFDETKDMLEKIRAPQEAHSEWNEILHSVENEKTPYFKIHLLKKLFSKKFLPVLLLGCGLALIQQLSGINAILYYTPVVLKNAEFHSIHSLLLGTLLIGITNFVFTFLAFVLCDKVGRRPLLLTGLILMVICLCGMASVLPLCHHASFYKGILLCFTLLYIAAFASSIGCLFWVIIAEIYPLLLRGVAMSIATAVNWSANLLISATFLTLIEKIGLHHLFWCYAGFVLLGIIFCYFYLPETKNISLEEIEHNLIFGKKLRELGGK